ncbi:C40 family peptidase [Sphaerisporangium rubeum]|uniref:Cell wall-associated NlpC family hydrolase n=1 Tax=Sphaerisporangium rubeum TaxID=321317 RepID=A0A7X0IJB2_9ACTN|nr:cell wall-associated NlpC family hydrolase [Sphaerisporangium rubeum]
MFDVRNRRIPAAAGLAAALLLVFQAGAAADPRPTVAQARARLAQLNDKADATVERFNAISEKYKASKKKYERLNQEYAAEQAKVDDLRESVVSAASGMYQYNGLSSVVGIVSDADPDGLLAGLAVAGQVSAGQAQTLTDFDKATKGLRVRRANAKTAYDELGDLLGDVAKEKKKVEKLVGEQEALLRRLNQFNPGNPSSKGVTYDGPASGSARKALQFAYAQVGKPYRYGATGPGAYDCSGFAQASWAAAGVKLPRTTYQQWAWGASRRVSMNALEPGDLIFSNGLGHMGIYAGDGKMVHAPRTGDVVKIVTLSSYGTSRFVGAVRP